jgi:hypothetical protein
MTVTILPRQDYVFADDFADLQSAIDLAETLDRPVFLGPREYTADQITLRNGTRLYGSGKYSTKITCTKEQIAYPSATSAQKTYGAFIRNVGYRQDSTQALLKNIEIKDLEIAGNKIPDAFSVSYEHYHGIGLTAVQDSVIENCHIHDFAGDGVSIGNNADAGVNSNIQVRFNHFKNCLRGGTTVITGQNIFVFKNYFTGQGHCGMHVEAGTSTHAKDCDGIYVDGNVMESVEQYPLWGNNSSPEEWYQFHFTNNVIRNCANIQSFQIECQDALIHGNTFFNCTASSYFWSLGGDIQFTNNKHIGCTSGAAFMRVLGHYTRERVDTTIQNNVFDITGPDNTNTNIYAIFTSTAGGFDAPRGMRILDNTFRCQGIETVHFSDRTDMVVRGNRYDSGGAGDPKYIYYRTNYANVSEEMIHDDLVANLTAVVGGA